MARVLIVLALVLALAPAAARAQANPARTAQSVTIHRDGYGVPHITGPTDASVVFALAYAQAEDNFPHLEDNFIRAIGRAAEVHGAGALRDDQMVVALDIVALSRAEYARAPRRMRALYDAFAAGLNYYVARNQQGARALLGQFEPWFPLALLRYKYHLLEFVGYAGLDPQDYRPVADPAPPERAEGSNAWAIAPARTTSGAAMLLINPHIGFYGVAQYYEAHLISGEGWTFSGVGRYGFPFPYMGHTDALGWAHTDNYPDIGDLYIEHFDDPAHPLAYRYGRGWRTARETQHSAVVRGDDGASRTETFTVRRTHHGPIVAEQDGRPLAIRLSMLEEGGWFDQWYAMSKARNFTQFRRALERDAIPYMNVVYADRDGNIFYAYNAVVPQRTPGFDYLRPVDGADPRTEWRGYHRFRELPQVLNPPSGFVQNTNSSPFFTTEAANPRAEDFPSYMIGPEVFNPRAQVSHSILEGERRFSFEDWTRAATDTRVWEAQRFIPELRAGYAAFARHDPDAAARIEPVLAALEAWDQRGAEDAIGMTVFVRWFLAMRDAGMPEDATQRLLLVDATRASLVAGFGDWRVRWGDANRHQRRHWNGAERGDDSAPSLPAIGGPGWVGIVFNFYTAPPTEHGRAYGRMGNSYVSVVEFAAEAQAGSIVYFGQSGRPDSAHYFDQAPLYARGEFKPAPTGRAEALAAAVRSYHPGD